jgi:hypothetical protein
MNLDNFTLHISFPNFNNQECIHLFLTNNLFNYCIDYQHDTLTAVSKIDYKEVTLIKFNPNFIPSNKEGGYSISTDETGISIYFFRNNSWF